MALYMIHVKCCFKIWPADVAIGWNVSVLSLGPFWQLGNQNTGALPPPTGPDREIPTPALIVGLGKNVSLSLL